MHGAELSHDDARLLNPKDAHPSAQTSPAPQAPLPHPGAYDLAFTAGDVPEYAHVPKHVSFAQLTLIWGLMGLGMGAINALRVLLGFFLLPPWLILPVAGGFILIVLLLMARKHLSLFFAESAIPLKPLADPAASTRRLRVQLPDRPSIELLRSIEEGRFGFEPEIARVPLAVGLDPGARRLAWLGGVLGCLTAVLVELLFRRPLAELSMSVWFVMGLAALGAVGLPEFVFPTYVRVIPGRLDVIRAPIVGPGMRTVLSIDLRSRPLFLTRFALFAEPAREPGTPLPPKVWGKRWSQGMVHPPESNPEAVSLALTPDRRRLLRAILWGATTEAPTPDVPGDRLIG